jgi:hypothetical protein
MEIEYKIPTLDTTRKLNWQGETEHYWICNQGNWLPVHRDNVLMQSSTTTEKLKSPCFAELWEKMPQLIHSNNNDYGLRIDKSVNDKSAMVSYRNFRNETLCMPLINPNPAEALAKMYLWLTERSLV